MLAARILSAGESSAGTCLEGWILHRRKAVAAGRWDELQKLVTRLVMGSIPIFNIPRYYELTVSSLSSSSSSSSCLSWLLKCSIARCFAASISKSTSAWQSSLTRYGRNIVIIILYIVYLHSPTTLKSWFQKFYIRQHSRHRIPEKKFKFVPRWKLA